MSYAYKDPETGQVFQKDEIKQYDKCDFCGKLAEGEKSPEYVDGEFISMHGAGHDTGISSICYECLSKGIDEEKVKEELDYE